MTDQQRTIHVQAAGRRQKFFMLFLPLIAAFELCYLLIIALSAAPSLPLSSTPLTTSWSWTLLPYSFFHNAATAFTSMLAHPDWLASFMLGIVLLGLQGIYAGALALARRIQNSMASGWLYLLLGVTLAFGLTLLIQPRLFSDDIFTYIFSGRILGIYRTDPMNTAPIQFPGDPYIPWVISGRDTANIYGPLWLYICSFLARISNDPLIILLVFKSVALLSHLLNIILAWIILGQIAPARRLQGTLLYAWNPLALIELAGSGHNDGVLLTMLLLATWLYIRKVQQGDRWSAIWPLLVFGLAISINFVTLLLIPLLIWFDLRTERRLLKAALRCGWQLLIMVAPAILLLLPFWRGPVTFFAITSAIDMQHFVHSPVGLLAIPLRSVFQMVAIIGHFPPILQPVPAADMTVRASALFIFALIYSHLFGSVRAAPSANVGERRGPNVDREMILPGFDVLLRSWTIVTFSYLTLASGWFWPWYVLWILWIVLQRRLDALTIAILLLAGTALIIYPFIGFSKAPIATYQAALIFGIPLVYITIAGIRQRRAERITISHDGRSETTQN